VFGNQWNRAVIEPTVIYAVPGAVETKYIDRIKATVAAAPDNFELLDDIEDFDYSWRPNPKDPPYIYVFGNQWLSPEQRPALQYRVAGAVHIKYMNHPKAQRKSNPDKFLKHYNCEFDWSWEPDPGDPALIYVFGNQWWSAEIMPTVEYHTPVQHSASSCTIPLPNCLVINPTGLNCAAKTLNLILPGCQTLGNRL
jgi:hypothetical protein